MPEGRGLYSLPGGEEQLGESEEQSESRTGQGRSEGGEEWPKVRQGPAGPGKGTVPVEF